ncbi:MAG: hypothetical protein EZS28_015414 [Streblomastix strix]|uniref:Uncharacterized protein n=1 Tax=Streblomastix strix TaxID=222440 RepID=A0A5J4W2L9_9EUKA|nr:MAG: hypothetical protein EZS28_015414 [Streblomastix strix]
MRQAWGLPFGERISDIAEVKAQEKQINKQDIALQFFMRSDLKEFCVESQQNGFKYNQAVVRIKPTFQNTTSLSDAPGLGVAVRRANLRYSRIEGTGKINKQIRYCTSIFHEI